MNKGLIIPGKVQMQPTAHLRILREKMEDGSYNMVFQQLHVGPKQAGKAIGTWKPIPILDAEPVSNDSSDESKGDGDENTKE
jgi:hypothetical protein